MYVWVYVYVLCMYMGMYMCICVYVCLYVFVCMLQRCEPAVWPKTGNRGLRPDPDSYSLWTRYPGDSNTDPWMIRRFVPVRAVKTGWRFRSKTALFHVSVYLLVYFLNSSIFILSFQWMCIWFLHYSIQAHLLLYCDALALFYWYVVYTILDLV